MSSESRNTPNVISNTKSEARDHLANERTFLAWLRTALGLVGLGVLLSKFELGAGGEALLTGAGMVVVAAVVLIYSAYRYYRVNRLLLDGQFPVARRGPLMIALIALVITVGALVWIVLSQSG